jgi:nitroreductase
MTSQPVEHTVIAGPTNSAAHAARPPAPLRRLMATTALGAILLAAIALGLTTCLRSLDTPASTPTSAQLITVTPPEHP